MGQARSTQRRKPKVKKDEEALRDRLYRQNGQLQVELDWLKKKVGHDD